MDSYIQKLYDLTTEQTQRMAYQLRDVIQYSEDIYPMDCALKGVLSLTKNIENVSMVRKGLHYLNLDHANNFFFPLCFQDMAVIILQALAYLLKEFVPRVCTEEDPITDEEYEAARLLCISGATLLSAILNAICTLIEKFKIDWTRSLETLCLLKFTSVLLDNPNLSPLVS